MKFSDMQIFLLCVGCVISPIDTNEWVDDGENMIRVTEQNFRTFKWEKYSVRQLDLVGKSTNFLSCSTEDVTKDETYLLGHQSNRQSYFNGAENDINPRDIRPGPDMRRSLDIFRMIFLQSPSSIAYFFLESFATLLGLAWGIISMFIANKSY